MEPIIDAGAIRDRLADHMRHDRSVGEAAGEEQWLAGLQQRMGLLSQQMTADLVRVTEDWLEAEMGDQAALGKTVAAMYARFLTEHVDIRELRAPPRAIVDNAWRQWREQSKPGNV